MLVFLLTVSIQIPPPFCPLPLLPFPSIPLSRWCTVDVHDFAYCREQERTMRVKTPKGAAAFYGGLEPSSVDFLVSSRSLTNSGIITNSGSSHSVAGVYYNSGFEVSNNSLSGSGDLGFHIVSADVISRRPTPSTYVWSYTEPTVLDPCGPVEEIAGNLLKP